MDSRQITTSLSSTRNSSKPSKRCHRHWTWHDRLLEKSLRSFTSTRTRQRLHKLDRVPPSSQWYSRNDSLPVNEPHLFKIWTAFKGQLWPRNPLHRQSHAGSVETPEYTGQAPYKPSPNFLLPPTLAWTLLTLLIWPLLGDMWAKFRPKCLKYDNSS